jgi:hypothetical protein
MNSSQQDKDNFVEILNQGTEATNNESGKAPVAKIPGTGNSGINLDNSSTGDTSSIL